MFYLGEVFERTEAHYHTMDLQRIISYIAKIRLFAMYRSVRSRIPWKLEHSSVSKYVGTVRNRNHIHCSFNAPKSHREYVFFALLSLTVIVFLWFIFLLYLIRCLSLKYIIEVFISRYMGLSFLIYFLALQFYCFPNVWFTMFNTVVPGS